MSETHGITKASDKIMLADVVSKLDPLLIGLLLILCFKSQVY
jgi:hypothetical protein